MPKTIFIIDDDPTFQMVLELALRDAGYNIEIANNGLEGINRLASLRPDLVISDIMMPQMDGIEVFQSIKERLQDEGIPIIIVTALNRKPWFSDLEDEGAVILQKPFEVDRMVDLIGTMIGG